MTCLYLSYGTTCILQTHHELSGSRFCCLDASICFERCFQGLKSLIEVLDDHFCCLLVIAVALLLLSCKSFGVDSIMTMRILQTQLGVTGMSSVGSQRQTPTSSWRI